ncbi:hypothetical protein ACFYRY_23265 [Streptomyces sp. NPDC005263]|uniref:hypothetical protein n=1 Tax=Streptomyces sp. NPDC005263 TaxID=3364711 RepID=UPI0036CA8D32
MRFSLSRWRLLLLAVITACAVTLLTTTEALAAEPGESNQWTGERENGIPAQAGGDIQEARNPNTGQLVQIWRGWSDNSIYVSLNNNQVRLWPAPSGGTRPQTLSNPQIVFNGGYWWAFHTGVDRRVYYSRIAVNDGVLSLGSWYRIPNEVETPNNLSVAVASLPNNGWYLTYRGASSEELWGIYYNGQNGQWDLPVTVPGATSYSAPALAWSSYGQALVLVYRGLDDRVNVRRQHYGNPRWTDSEILNGVTTDAQPAVAFANNGFGQVAVRRPDTRLSLTTINEVNGYAGWSNEINGFTARYGPVLVASLAAIYLIATSGNGYVYWKQSRQF